MYRFFLLCTIVYSNQSTTCIKRTSCQRKELREERRQTRFPLSEQMKDAYKNHIVLLLPLFLASAVMFLQYYFIQSPFFLLRSMYLVVVTIIFAEDKQRDQAGEMLMFRSFGAVFDFDDAVDIVDEGLSCLDESDEFIGSEYEKNT